MRFLEGIITILVLFAALQCAEASVMQVEVSEFFHEQRLVGSEMEDAIIDEFLEK